MRFFKSLISAAAFMAVAGGANAALVTVTVGDTVYKGVKLSGTETLTLSANAMGFTDTVRGTYTANGTSVLTANRDTDGYFTDVSLASPLSSLSIENTTDQLASVAASGGLTLTVPVLRAVSSGGTLTINDLNVDLNSKKIYATVTGGNGVGTLTNFALWDFDAVAGNTKFAPGSGASVSNFTVSGLHFTMDGIVKIISSLGLSNLGRAALMGIDDFGTLGVSVNGMLPPLSTCSVKFKTTYKNPALFTTEVTVGNASSNPQTGWKVNWHYNKPTLLLSIKDTKITSKPGLKNFTASPLASNATIPAGASTTFSFRGHADGGLPALSDLSANLGGQSCVVSAQ